MRDAPPIRPGKELDFLWNLGEGNTRDRRHSDWAQILHPGFTASASP